MTDHEPYEVLCALAATGQLVGPEKANFDDHCIQCRACRHQLQDLISIGLQLQESAAIHAISAPMAAGSLERFRARAIREGIALRSAPARPSTSYALASAAAVFVIVAALVFVPGRRKAPESLAMSAAAPIPIRQSLPASVTRRKSTAQPSKAIHAHFVRHRFVSRTDTAVNEARLTTQQFPRVITASYPLFGPASATKPLATAYSELSRSQIPHFALFPKLDDSSATNLASIGTSNRPVDIALTGRVFDFATNIRQIYFQLPTAQ
jgi:hypothetical protein